MTCKGRVNRKKERDTHSQTDRDRDREETDRQAQRHREWARERENLQPMEASSASQEGNTLLCFGREGNIPVKKRSPSVRTDLWFQTSPSFLSYTHT